MLPRTMSCLVQTATMIAAAAFLATAPSPVTPQANAAEACPCFTAQNAAQCDVGGLGPTFTLLGDYAGDDKSLVVTCGDLRAEHPLYTFRQGNPGCANFSGSSPGFLSTTVGQAQACASLLGDEWMKRNNR